MPDNLSTILRQIFPEPVKTPFKKLRFILRRLRRIILRQPRTILFYPHFPPANEYDYTINVICDHLGCRMTSNPDDRYDAVLHWEDTTFRQADKRLEEIAKRQDVINIQCGDISKTRVSRIFQEVFGYGVAVDPLTYRGTCVEKSDLNSTHDGRLLECPLTTVKDGCVYQKLIDCSCSDELNLDHRVPVFKGEIPFVYLKYKRRADRFGKSVRNEIAAAEDVFNNTEIRNIKEFCRRMGLDFGELDIVRDNAEGKFYIIDANNTPSIRMTGATHAVKAAVVARLSRAFEDAFLRRAAGQ